MDLIVANTGAATGPSEDACATKDVGRQNGLGDFLSIIRQLPDMSDAYRTRIMHSCSETFERGNAEDPQLLLHMHGEDLS